ncbi:hypothetical protein E5676_scaffold110G001560 [Cucumis melo var. makuwa]|uniref:Uncharacterized protein n=1 Tax=Cucumis melo var. makuwa TaxID=1194695 RepID=A0A5A7T5P5_CUCMM|nr:hypothetical protein E6C27_scaffold20G00840 [Cucumis melo var. makuwa]TYJ95862.1 hypothetical protein E5676_scaffold110G001560 [Cucumis melo var. makuwa]
MVGASKISEHFRDGVCSTTTRDGVLPTHKYVSENAKYVGKGYPDVQNGIGKNVGRNASREAFLTPYQFGVGKGFPEAGSCAGIDGVGKTLFLMLSMPTHLPASGKPVFRRFFPNVMNVGKSFFIYFFKIFYFYFFPYNILLKHSQ